MYFIVSNQKKESNLSAFDGCKDWCPTFTPALFVFMITGQMSHMYSLGGMKMSVFIILFPAITNEKERVAYDNESFDPCWSSVYWWAIVQRQT